MARAPRSPEVRERQARAMREYWANLTSEQRQEIAAKQSLKLKGQKRSPEQRLRNSNAQKGKALSSEHRAKVSEGFKKAYSEGRKQPVRSPHRKGTTLSPEARAKISAALKGAVPWNIGKETGPRSEEVMAFQEQYPLVQFQIVVREGIK